MLVLTAIPIVLLTVGLVLLWWARAKLREAGLPQGRVVYDDTGARQERPSPLFSRRHLLTGKPDYIVAQGEDLIPVEVKSRRKADKPYDSDVLQLAAYCLLIEDSFGKPPPYGMIKYDGATFVIEYSSELRRQLLGTMQAMRLDLGTEDIGPSHNSHGRCLACGHHHHCGESVDSVG